MDVITYPCWDLSYTIKGVSGLLGFSLPAVYSQESGTRFEVCCGFVTHFSNILRVATCDRVPPM